MKIEEPEQGLLPGMLLTYLLLGHYITHINDEDYSHLEQKYRVVECNKMN